MLKSWIDQLRWQRLKLMEKLADMLLRHLEGIPNYRRTKVPLGVVETVNGNIKALLRRARGTASSFTCFRKRNGWPPQEPNSSLFRKLRNMTALTSRTDK
jgi:transposase